jgi:hypothetical protein
MTLTLPFSSPYLDRTSKAIKVPVRPIPALRGRKNKGTCIRVPFRQILAEKKKGKNAKNNNLNKIQVDN